MNIEKDTKQAMENAIQHLKEQLKNLRTSRANPGMLDSVQVMVYGASMRLKDIANITAPEPRQLLITPFDQNNTAAIAKGIEQANLGQPIIDGYAVRMNIPPMDTNTRQEIVKVCRKKTEEAKIVIREIRRKKNEFVRSQSKQGMSEDMQKSYEKKIQQLTDSFCTTADEMCSAKEKEILEI